jgi:Ca2+-binding EF-hand superfamily protein
MEKAMKLDKATAALWLALASVSATASAQTATVPDPQQMRAKMTERFAAADANHDGKLTRDEAEAKMPMVARNFDQIDKAHKGYVTLDEIQAFTRERMAERRAAKAGTTN